MALTPEGAAITEEYRLAQLGVRAQAIRDIAKTYPLWITDAGMSEAYLQMLSVILNVNRERAAALAAAYYRAFRAAEGVPGMAEIIFPDALPLEQIAASLEATGRATQASALRAGMSAQAAAEQGFTSLAGSMGRHVLNAGRETILKSGRYGDDYALGWARVTDGAPCAFCAMLASRGAVYWSQGTAGFQAHDHCGCIPEVRFEGEQQPDPNREEYRDQWNALTMGYSGKAAIRAFRRGYKPPGTT